MKPMTKLSSEERRAAIIKAVRQVFAEKGFHGTLTRELAEAAGVSEALLFKHFPNKEALYSAMMLSCCEEENPETAQRLMDLEPSATGLVILLHSLVSHLLEENETDDDPSIQIRLMLRSMMEDGEFARLFLQQVGACWMDKISACLDAAVLAGDAVAGPPTARVAGWLLHYLIVMIFLSLQATPPIVDYGVTHKKLVKQVVWFTLRGMGLKEETIKRCYNSKTMAWFDS